MFLRILHTNISCESAKVSPTPSQQLNHHTQSLICQVSSQVVATGAVTSSGLAVHVVGCEPCAMSQSLAASALRDKMFSAL